MEDGLSKKIQRTLQRTQRQCDDLLNRKFISVSASDTSEYIPLTMRITDKQDGSEFDVVEMINHIHDRPVALVGAPGVGKSTLLLKFAILLSEKAKFVNFDDCDDSYIPVFISAGRMTDYKDAGIISCIHITNNQSETERLLEEGRLCIIVDGLNESRVLDVETLLRGIYDLYDKYPDCKYIVSCRSLEFPRKWDTYWDLFSINPVSDTQILAKFKQDLASVEDAKKFFNELATSRGRFMLNMCRNPLLLTLVIRIIREETKNNPNYSLKDLRNKGAIYKRFCEILDDYRARKLDHDERRLPPIVGKDILSTVAYYMQSTKSVYIQWNDDEARNATGDVLHSIETLIRTMSYDSDSSKNYVDVLKELKGEHSWYQETSSELKKSSYFRVYSFEGAQKAHSLASFVHQSFGEYFAGVYICDHLGNKELLNFLLSPNFDSKKNWNVIEFASCLDESFSVLENVLDYATSYRDSNALLLTSRCLTLNANDSDVPDAYFQKIVDNCCVWLLDAFKYWGIAYNYELIYAASRLLAYASENLPLRIADDIRYFSDKYAGGYDAIDFPFFFDIDHLVAIANNMDEPIEYRANAIYTLGSRKWKESDSLRVRDFLFKLLNDSNIMIREQAMKALKNLLENFKEYSATSSLFTEDMFQVLLSMIRNPNESPRMRTYVLNTVAETGDGKTIGVFIDYLKDKSNPYRDSASWSLQELILKSNADFSDMCKLYLDCLINESTDTTGIYSKGNLVYTLSKIGDRSKIGDEESDALVGQLKEWLNKEVEPYVLEDGINAIGELAGHSEVEYIRRFTKSDDPVIRAKAYKSVFNIVGRIGLSSIEIDSISNDYYSIVRKSIEVPKDASKDSSLSSVRLDTLLNLSIGRTKQKAKRVDTSSTEMTADTIIIEQYTEYPPINPSTFTADN